MGLRSYLSGLRAPLWVARGIAKESGAATAAKWLAFSALGRRKVMSIQVRGTPLKIRTGTTDALVAIISTDGEFDELIAVCPTIRHGFIIDAGGYIGTAAIVFAKAYPEATVVSIEASKANFELLAENVKPYPNIKPIYAALSGESGTIELRDRGLGNWGFTVARGERRAGAVLHRVECVTVGDILGQFGTDGIDIVKMDIEGAEHGVLSSNSEWVDRTDALCVELHDWAVPGCTEVYEKRTTGRVNTKLAGEKFVSFRS